MERLLLKDIRIAQEWQKVSKRGEKTIWQREKRQHLEPGMKISNKSISLQIYCLARQTHTLHCFRFQFTERKRDAKTIMLLDYSLCNVLCILKRQGHIKHHGKKLASRGSTILKLEIIHLWSHCWCQCVFTSKSDYSFRKGKIQVKKFPKWRMEKTIFKRTKYALIWVRLPYISEQNRIAHSTSISILRMCIENQLMQTSA